jgi:hypothetical protein
VRLLGAGYTPSQGDAERHEPVQTEAWDLADPALARRIGRGTIDSPARMALRWDNGEKLSGLGVTESAIARDHWRYGSQIDGSR